MPSLAVSAFGSSFFFAGTYIISWAITIHTKQTARDRHDDESFCSGFDTPTARIVSCGHKLYALYIAAKKVNQLMRESVTLDHHRLG